MSARGDTLLDLRDLSVSLRSGRETLVLVDGVSLSVGRGEVLGLVGESGCGKSLTAFAVMNLFPSPALSITGGEIRLDGEDLCRLPPSAWRAVRGRRIAMVFQDPSSFLDPLMTVGAQVAEPLRAHGRFEGADARVRELLDLMELPGAELARKYPHELSGGQRQRVMIAAALAAEPALLIADEPTTALDVTVQAGILDLLLRLRDELSLSLLLITHDLGVVAQTCDRVAVMYAGRVVETAGIEALFAAPRHPYTQGLLRSTLGPGGELFSIPGRVPSARAMPRGCRFHPRCPLARPDPCVSRDPPLMPREPGRADACWLSAEAGAAWAREAPVREPAG